MSAPVEFLRPLANPLPLGFLALAGATLLVSGLQLGWVAVYAALAMALEDALGRTVLPIGRHGPP